MQSKLKFIAVISFLTIVVLSNCKDKKNNQEETPVTPTTTLTPDINNTYGFNLLKKLKGIWNGPVTSTTPLGGYPEWIVDFRPNSENQISAKNELDTLNDIFMSFFVAKYNNQYKVAFRNGGSFGGAKRVSYFLADSVSETSSKSFYRFSEIIKGKSRAFTDIIFSADSLYIKSYTNKYNTLSNATLHMSWSAKLQDTTSCQTTTSYFSFPKKTLTRDFSSTFNGQLEAIYFSTTGIPAGDPYPEPSQPYLGQTIANYSFGVGYTPVSTKKVFLVITTQPLFNGFTFNSNNLKYRSRYVILSANDLNFTFNYMHPGTYYYYAFYDNDGNNLINSGDWISTTNTTFNLTSQGNVTTNTQINFTIP
ncbi:MAG: hypothetical protein SFY56_10245 [Bacteroidota bacterium]|nr:hypothetical protein [Bacteroidota bacterium]